MDITKKLKRSNVEDKAKRANLKTGVSRKQSAPNFPKTDISYPLTRTRTCEYQGVRNVRFSEKFGVLCFLETPFLRFPLLPYYLRILLWRLPYFIISLIKLIKLFYILH